MIRIKTVNFLYFLSVKKKIVSATFAGFSQERVKKIINGKSETPDSGLRQYTRL
jgi:hypothetical protein